jgi:hypothetical protein
MSNLSYITLKLRGVNTRALLDSGSFYSLISQNLANRLRIRSTPLTPETEHALFSATGSRLKLNGTADVTLDISNLKITHTVFICQNLNEDLILGRSFLSDASAIVDFKNRTVSFSDVIQVPLHNGVDKTAIARATESVFVPPNSEIVFQVSCHQKFENQHVVLSPIEGQQFSRYAVANSLGTVNNNQTFCRLMNFQNTGLVISPGQKIGQLRVLDTNQKCLLVSSDKQTGDSFPISDEKQTFKPNVKTLNEFAAEQKFNINPDLSPELRMQLLEVLYKRRQAFARSVSDLKAYNKQEFELKLKPNAKPAFQRQFRHKPEHAKILQHHVNEWEKQGIVTSSDDYDWNSPIFLVPKSTLRDATDKENPAHYRPVIDMRGVNQLLLKHVVFTPPTREIIDEIVKYSDDNPPQRAKYFSTFDLFQGFMQIKLKPGLSRHITGFIAPSGRKMEMTRIPFGSSVSVGIFSSIMERLFAPMKAKGGLSYYVDDLITYTATPSEHLQKIDEVLEILIENDLRCSTKKTFFMFTEIRHLGVNIGPQGVSVPEEVTRTLDKLETKPIKTVKQLLGLLGYLNFWRLHIKNLALRTENMRKLTQKGVPFHFDEACQRERIDVINALRNAPTLQPIAPNKPIWLIIDSSKAGVGFTVAQSAPESTDSEKDIARELAQLRRGAPSLRPVYHLSYATGNAQKMYGSTALELWGTQRALISLEYLATNRTIHIVSDNIGVTSLHKLRMGNARERRLLAYLMQFDLVLHFLSGKTNSSADYLSRFQAEMPEGERVRWQSKDDDVLDDYLFAINTEEQDENSEEGVGQWYAYLVNTADGGGMGGSNRPIYEKARYSKKATCPIYNDTGDVAVVAITQPGIERPNESDAATMYMDAVNTKQMAVGDVRPLSVSTLNADAEPFVPAIAQETQVKQHVFAVSKNKKRAAVPTEQTIPETVVEQFVDENELDDQNQPHFHEPILSAQDYIEDAEYGPMYTFLSQNTLTGNKTIDYRTCLMAPQYVVENEKLYRLTLPRSKKRSADGVIRKVIVIPKRFENSVLIGLHSFYGHAAGEKLFQTARLLFFMRNLYQACHLVGDTCALCQECKIDRRRLIPELNKVPRFAPGTVFYIDHKVLARKTPQGYTMILAMADSYSNYAYFEPVPDASALSTAKAIIRRLLPDHISIQGLISDKGSAFINKVFKLLTSKILGAYHFSSASRNPQSHGAIENLIAQLNKGISLYAKSDAEIPEILPLIEMYQRLMVQKGMAYSPFEILRGYLPSIHLPGEILDDNAPVLPHHEYLIWLKDRLTAIRSDVDQNVECSRLQQKEQYDKRFKTKKPDFCVGDVVLLHAGNPRAHSDQVLTHKRFGDRRYYITRIVGRKESFVPSDGNPYPTLDQTSIAPAYELTDTQTGRTLRHLVSAHRIKKFRDIAEFNKQHPPHSTPNAAVTDAVRGRGDDRREERQPTDGAAQTQPAMTTKPSALADGWHAAKCIVRKRVQNGELFFLVKFADSTHSWVKETDVSDELKKRFFMRLAATRKRRQKAARERFKDA